MTNPHTEGLGRLIERLERERPNRELANEVLLACGWTYAYEMERGTKVEYWRSPNTPPGQCEQYPLPNPLSSLDAAVSLVPEDASSWDCGRIDQEFCASVEFPVDVDGFHNYHARSKANASIALCIAALKARAAIRAEAGDTSPRSHGYDSSRGITSDE